MDNTETKTLTTKGMGKELGKSGTFIYKGIISLEEYNTTLQNPILSIKAFDTMRRSDATVRSTLQVCKLPVQSAEWGLKPASDDKADIEVADFIHRELFDRNVDFNQFMKEGLLMLDFGYSVAEKVLELTEFNGQTRIGITKLAYRKQRSIQAWETKDGKLGVTQQLLSGDSISIPMQKLIVFTNDKEGDNYAGISCLRYAYKHWHIKDKLDIINAIALEKLAIGVPVIKKPSDADEGDLTRARDAVRNFRANEEAYLEAPVGWDVEMMDMKASTTKDVLPSVQYHDRQIQISVLAQFLSLGASDASGSRAVSEDHSKLFLLSEEALAKNIKSTLQEQLIKQLCDLNYSNLPNGYPELTFSKIGDEDAVALSSNVKELMSAGALTYDPALEEHLRKVLKLPDLPVEIKEKFEADLKEVEKAKKTVKKNDEVDESDLEDEDDSDPKKSKKEIEASAIAHAKRAKARLIDVIVG